MPKINVMHQLSYKILINFFNAMMEDKIDLENIVHKDTYEKFKDSFLLNMKSFKENYGKIDFDKDLETIMSLETKKHVFTMCKGNKQKFKI